MIGKILLGLLQFVSTVLDIILFPVNTVINTFIPDLSQALGQVANFFNLCAQYIGWGISALGIPQYLVQLMTSVLIFKLLVYPAVWLIKLIIKWYKAIVP